METRTHFIKRQGYDGGHFGNMQIRVFRLIKFLRTFDMLILGSPGYESHQKTFSCNLF